jgi:hypothetical protein
MALISYGIQLTSTSANAGPEYNVFYSTDCVGYTFAGIADLPNTSSIEYLDIEETSTCIRLVSRGGCQNGVVSGSSPSADAYNTYELTLTQKNGAGPEFIVSENTGSGLYNTFDTIELPAQGSTAIVNPSPEALAIRLRSNGVCTTTQDIIISSSVAPTPTPTPSPSPTPGPTPTPSPTPGPTPTPAPNCFTFYTIYSSTLSATDACCNQFQTKPVFLDASSLATATTVYDNATCTALRTTQTYYTQNLSDYYFWTGASLVGPTGCPGCP